MKKRAAVLIFLFVVSLVIVRAQAGCTVPYVLDKIIEISDSGRKLWEELNVGSLDMPKQDGRGHITMLSSSADALGVLFVDQGGECYVEVYDTNMEFLYGIYFRYIGATAILNVNSQSVVIEIARHPMTYEIDSSGQLMGMYAIQTNPSSNEDWSVIFSSEYGQKVDFHGYQYCYANAGYPMPGYTQTSLLRQKDGMTQEVVFQRAIKDYTKAAIFPILLILGIVIAIVISEIMLRKVK